MKSRESIFATRLGRPPGRMADRVHLTVLGVLDVLETQVARERGMLTECCLQVEVREREARFLDCGVVKCGPRSEALLVGPLKIFSPQSDGVGHCWTGSACQDARLPGLPGCLVLAKSERARTVSLPRPAWRTRFAALGCDLKEKSLAHNT